MSERTKKVKKLFFIFGALSLITFIGVALFAIISVFVKAGKPDISSEGFANVANEASKVLDDNFVKKIVGLGITTIILLILSLVMSNKIRTTVWIASMIISTIIYGEAAMYIISSIWLINEYVFSYLAKHYKEKLSINKEIDLRDIEHGNK